MPAQEYDPNEIDLALESYDSRTCSGHSLRTRTMCRIHVY